METKPKVLKLALIIGIVIVLNLFFNYAISLFYKEPNYDVFFAQPQVVQQINTKEECLKVGGQWNEGSAVYPQTNPAPASTPDIKSFCNPNFTKQQEFDQAREIYNRNIFIILVVLGAIFLLVGAFVVNEIVSLGLSWGGVLSLIIASMRYWSDADNWVKVLILAIALVTLFWIAIKKFGKQ